MTAVADTLYLPILAPAKEAVPDAGMRQERNAPQPKLYQQKRHRLYRIPSRQIVKGMTYGPDGSVAVERTSGALIDIYA